MSKVKVISIQNKSESAIYFTGMIDGVSQDFMAYINKWPDGSIEAGKELDSSVKDNKYPGKPKIVYPASQNKSDGKPVFSSKPSLTVDQIIREKALSAAVQGGGSVAMFFSEREMENKEVVTDEFATEELFWIVVKKFEKYIREGRP